MTKSIFLVLFVCSTVAYAATSPGCPLAEGESFQDHVTLESSMDWVQTSEGMMVFQEFLTLSASFLDEPQSLVINSSLDNTRIRLEKNDRDEYEFDLEMKPRENPSRQGSLLCDDKRMFDIEILDITSSLCPSDVISPAQIYFISLRPSRNSKLYVQNWVFWGEEYPNFDLCSKQVINIYPIKYDSFIVGVQSKTIQFALPTSILASSLELKEAFAVKENGEQIPAEFSRVHSDEPQVMNLSVRFPQPNPRLRGVFVFKLVSKQGLFDDHVGEGYYAYAGFFQVNKEPESIFCGFLPNKTEQGSDFFWPALVITACLLVLGVTLLYRWWNRGKKHQQSVQRRGLCCCRKRAQGKYTHVVEPNIDTA
mmetsp:Transcript_52778/g.60416  ORF Transcript_52778/g.60416 Transcript_52778/m.60416 type:complete len:366 (-) Transcript_52778:152-1249(-)